MVACRSVPKNRFSQKFRLFPGLDKMLAPFENLVLEKLNEVPFSFELVPKIFKFVYDLDPSILLASKTNSG